jgi:hypothetical protein
MNDLPGEVLGTVYWTEQVGYQLNVTSKDGTTQVLNVEFINDEWYLLEGSPNGYRTNSSGKVPKEHTGIGNWPDDHPNNPKNIVFATAPSFGDFLLQGRTMASTSGTTPPPAQINMGGRTIPKGKKKDNHEENGNRGLRGKAPELFDRDRTKSKAFISDIQIYFKINRNKYDVKNVYSRVLLALSFIKGQNVVNWVGTQIDQLEENLVNICGGDEDDEDLWQEFEKEFKRAFISSTAKETAYIKLQALKMKGDQLDEYIADLTTLIGELGWDYDSEMSCHKFREGLPTPLARNIITMQGMPESLIQWIKFAQKYHSQWAMTKAFGYQGKKDNQGRFKPRFNPQKEKKKERDPDTMDVDFTQMSQDERERLMKSGSCFRCKKQGHMSKDCPTQQKSSIREAKVETEQPKKDKKKEKDEPPSYDSLLKQINACSMKDRQKILEVFSQDESEPEDF